MPFFKRQPPQTVSHPTWAPIFDLATARPVVLALANAPVSSAHETRAAINQLVRLSESPPFEERVRLKMQHPNLEVSERPWIWLIAVMQTAVDQKDYHLAAAALLWACYWTADLVPSNNLGGFMELQLDPISAERKRQIASLGLEAARALPPDFVVAAGESSRFLAGAIADEALSTLGL